MIIESISRTLMISLWVGTSIALFAVNASAVPIGSSSPIPGFGTDSGEELFLPNDVIVAFEIADLLGAARLSGFSFYFASDPGTLITIFGDDDQAAPSQGASVDFVNGIVFDVDAVGIQTLFTPSNDPIGFAFFFDFQPGIPGGEGIARSQVAFTGGVDAVGTYPSLSDPMATLITLELDGTLFAVENLQGIQAVPEPGTFLLVAAGLAGLAWRKSGRPGFGFL